MYLFVQHPYGYVIVTWICNQICCRYLRERHTDLINSPAEDRTLYLSLERNSPETTKTTNCHDTTNRQRVDLLTPEGAS